MRVKDNFDLVILGATPAGLMAAITASRFGKKSLVLERSKHIGGLPANGLGATDIGTRGGTGGLFMEFVSRIKSYYEGEYGKDSKQVEVCSDGYHFEPHVAEKILEDWVDEHASSITILKEVQFDVYPENVIHEEKGEEDSKKKIQAITVVHLADKRKETYFGQIFVDATYEGDLAAAAGAEFRIGREGKEEFSEPYAGRLYVPWWGEIQEGSSGLGDHAIQAFNYRMCITDDPDNRVPFKKPDHYRREEYVSLIEDVNNQIWSGNPGNEKLLDGIGRLTNIVFLPNGKTDANNQHLVLISTDLPEENWPWPMASWDWRDRFSRRLKDYILGLFWFAQNDEELPEDFKSKCREWGLAKDEYQDNENFPRQVYVREGRRVVGLHLFTAHDALPVSEGARPPVYPSSITASHYSLDSHAVMKRETGRDALEGFFNHRTLPYTVPYGVIVPKMFGNLLVPVAVSGTHIGFSTLRMEPCWIALGEAAGMAARQAIDSRRSLDQVCIAKLQKDLLDSKAVLIYFKNISPDHPNYQAIQFFALRGFFDGNPWEFYADEKPSQAEIERWKQLVQSEAAKEALDSPEGSKGEVLQKLYDGFFDEASDRWMSNDLAILKKVRHLK